MKRFFLTMAALLAGCGAEAEGPRELQVPLRDGGVQTVRVLEVADGRFDLQTGGARYELEVLATDDLTVHDLRDAHGATIALAETAADGTATLMNADGMMVRATPDVEPLADDDVAALFPPVVPVLLGTGFLAQLDGDPGVARSPLRVGGGGLGAECVNSCSNATMRCCCGEGYQCVATRVACECSRTGPAVYATFSY
jgi:hypothetical protein